MGPHWTVYLPMRQSSNILNFRLFLLLTFTSLVTSIVLMKVTIGLGAFIQNSYANALVVCFGSTECVIHVTFRIAKISVLCRIVNMSSFRFFWQLCKFGGSAIYKTSTSWYSTYVGCSLCKLVWSYPTCDTMSDSTLPYRDRAHVSLRSPSTYQQSHYILLIGLTV